MKLLLITLFLFSLFSFSVNAAETDDVSFTDPVEEVVISGRRPGPPLWRLENGENTLWVFAVVSPMPKSFEWDSSSIEHVISQSQEYLPAPVRSVGTSNPFKAIGMLRKLKKVQKLSDDRTLADILPTEEYETFQKLKNIYAPNNKKIEHLTPLFAARELHEGAKRQHGLIEVGKISRDIAKIAKRNKLEITKVKVHESIDSKPFFEDLRSLPESTHLECMQSTLNTLNNDVGALVNRAVLWADGNAQALVSDTQPQQITGGVCIEGLMQNDQVRRVIEQSRETWLNDAQQALEKNRSTFAVLRLEEVIEPDGLLSLLAARGYELYGPVRGVEAGPAD